MGVVEGDPHLSDTLHQTVVCICTLVCARQPLKAWVLGNPAPTRRESEREGDRVREIEGCRQTERDQLVLGLDALYDHRAREADVSKQPLRVRLCVYLHACVCVCMCACVRVCGCASVYACAWVRLCVRVCASVCLCVPVCERVCAPLLPSCHCVRQLAHLSATRYLGPSFSSSAMTQSVTHGIARASRQSMLACTTSSLAWMVKLIKFVSRRIW
jgi:hypothetical protein